MKSIRIIPRLDIKNDTVIKGINFEGLRVVGKPEELSQKYYEGGADELLYVDAVASLYDRNSLHEIIKKIARRIFVPLTVGGGIRNIEDITAILNSGADKVAINTAAVRNPDFLREAVAKFGSQCIVLSVQAKKVDEKKWEAYTESGRTKSGRDVTEWIKQAVDLGVGEVLLTSVDMDGTKKGFDMALVSAVAPECDVPVVVGGGAGRLQDISNVAACAPIDGIAIGTAYHYDVFSIKETKDNLTQSGWDVRL